MSCAKNKDRRAKLRKVERRSKTKFDYAETKQSFDEVKATKFRGKETADNLLIFFRRNDRNLKLFINFVIRITNRSSDDNFLKHKTMARNLKIRDLTLRDGQSSRRSPRMTQQQIDRRPPYYKAMRASPRAMEVGRRRPDSVDALSERENPWTRLETIRKAVGDVSKLTAPSARPQSFRLPPPRTRVIGRFLPQPIRSGLGIMRIFDALNDVGQHQVHGQIREAVRRHRRLRRVLHRRSEIPRAGILRTPDGPQEAPAAFTDAYFLDKARQMAALGADMITIKDMSV